MPELIAKCGIDCGACPWGCYPRQGMSDEEFETYRGNVRRVLGETPTRAPCVTCQTPDSQIPAGSRIPARSCRIRICVDRSGMANCAYCSRFPCDALTAKGALTRESVQAKLRAPMSEEEYRGFVVPFESLERLRAVRAGLKPGEVVEPARVPLSEAKTVGFPGDLPFSDEEIVAFRAVHDLLSALNRSQLGLRDTDTFAQADRLEHRRAHVFRFIWILGRYGELREEGTARLVVDPAAYMANRGTETGLAVWPIVRDLVCDNLAQLGVSCEPLPLKGAGEKNWVRDSGSLRGEGWVMSMSFEERAGGAPALRALQACAQALDEGHGKKAFRRFSQADMRVLSER